MQIYENLGDENQQTAVHFHLGNLHASHALVQRLSVDSDTLPVDVLCATAAEQFTLATTGFFPPARSKGSPADVASGLELALMTRKCHAQMHVNLVPRGASIAGFAVRHYVAALRELLRLPLAGVDVEVIAEHDRLRSELAQIVDLLRKTVLASMKHAAGQPGCPYSSQQLRAAYTQALAVNVGDSKTATILSMLLQVAKTLAS